MNLQIQENLGSSLIYLLIYLFLRWDDKLKNKL